MRFKKQEELKQRNLIVQEAGTAYAKDKNGKPTDEVKGHYAIVSLDQSLYKPDKIKSGEATVDTNPYLASKTVDHPNGGQFVDHKVFYQKSQWDKMVEAAGKKNVEIDGKTVLGIQADITPVKSSEKDANGKTPTVMIVNTAQPMGPSKNPYFGKTILDKQNAVTKAAKEVRAAQAETKTAPEVQAEAQTEAEAETPEVG